MAHPDTIPGRLLESLDADGTSPRLTWYGPGGERTELSGRVLANWVTKAANMLVEEGDVEPGTAVVVHLPVHWRALVWALAAWTAGAQVLPRDAGDAGTGAGGRGDATADEELATADGVVVVTSEPDHAPGREGADLVLAVALPSLAMSWDGPDLPTGVVDAAAELLGYGDALGYVVEPDDGDLAVGGDVTYGELASWAAGTVGAAAEEDRPARVLVSPASLHGLLRQAVGVWLAGGSVVLVEPGSGTAIEDVTAAERVDLRLDGRH
ncbi:hypothetical protein GCM10023169_41400 [Georgenia halophila]|uniref:TIGR03089 family protein n=1 Tax=Georgenia halophila TaxID=620889 RepID=A0ABP8LTG9_9MICO